MRRSFCIASIGRSGVFLFAGGRGDRFEAEPEIASLPDAALHAVLRAVQLQDAPHDREAEARSHVSFPPFYRFYRCKAVCRW